MDIFAIIIVILSLFALSWVVAYFLYDYVKYKDVVNTSISDAISDVQKEQDDRIVNLKYVVDQINNVNNDIYTYTATNTQTILEKETEINAENSRIIGGLSNLFNVQDSTGKSMPIISFSNMPCVGNTNINFMKHVNAVSGMTIKDVNKTDNSFSLCAKNDPTRCVKFPNSDGDTVIQNLDPSGNLIIQNNDVNKNIILDGNVLANNIQLQGDNNGNPSYIKTQNPQGLVIAANGDIIQGTVNGNNISIGNSIGLFANNSVSIGTQNNNGTVSLLVDNGGINTFKPINVYSSDGLHSIATISLSNNDLLIQSPNRIIFDAKSVKTIGNAQTDVLQVNTQLQGTLPQGPQGSLGMQGSIGPFGPSGPVGDRGNQGDPGLPGVPGINGAPGQTGLQGAQGYQGSTGNQGSTGFYQGPQGSIGPSGYQGPQGSLGLQGSMGTNVGIQGSQGMQGPQGPAGSATQGSQGIQGSQGYMGSGYQGSQGQLGSQGIQGSQGNQGSQGYKGSSGIRGPSGPAGQQGSQGPIGMGIAGSRGLPGPMGPQGSMGSQGPQGPSFDLGMY